MRIAGFAVALMLSSAVVAETAAERAFRMLRDSPPASPEAFDFIVVADTRSLKVDEQSETFRTLVHEFNALKPAFVVDVGDLILGGAASLVSAQWDEFERVTAQVKVPLFPVTGNHDISDAETERIWLERVGPTSYAFSYGNSRFIALNSEEIGAINRISDEQVDWLKQDLETCGARHVFIFLHKPYFAHEWGAEAWSPRWANVAEVLAGHPVRIVFGGDNHVYRYLGERDGIHYVVSAGGGAELRHPEDEGGFHHYVLVRVRGEDVSWSVIKPGAVLPFDVVTQARVDEVARVRREWIGTETLDVPVGEEAFDRKVTVFIQNPYDQSFESELTWDVPTGWTVEPANTRYTAAARDITYLEFTVRTDSPSQVRFPVPELTTMFGAARHGPPISVRRRLDLVPVYRASRMRSPAEIDGDLREWTSNVPGSLSYAWSYDIVDQADLSASCRLAWDDANLYLAVETQDDEFYQPYAGDIVWSADGIQLFIGGRWEWGLTLTQHGPEVFLYKGIDREAETVSTAVRLAVRRDGTRTIYESAFPVSELSPITLRAGETFAFSIVANDLDPSHPERPRHWAELTPGVGDAIPNSPMARIELVE
jgi:hypothetical protein